MDQATGLHSGDSSSPSRPCHPIEKDVATVIAIANNERIEYDDAAILAFHPHLRRRAVVHPRLRPKRLEFEHEAGRRRTERKAHEDSRDGVIEQTSPASKAKTLDPEEIAKTMLKGVHEKLTNVKQGISTCREEMKAIKTDFGNMNQTLDGMQLCHSSVKRQSQEFLDEMDVVIHQNKIIRYLVQAAREMELFECYVTEDSHVIFVDQPDEVLVEECSSHDGSDNNSNCTCKYKTKMELYSDVD